MTKDELKEWSILQIQFKNGYHLSKNDWQTLVRLNHLVLEATHKIHNVNMLRTENN